MRIIKLVILSILLVVLLFAFIGGIVSIAKQLEIASILILILVFLLLIWVISRFLRIILSSKYSKNKQPTKTFINDETKKMSAVNDTVVGTPNESNIEEKAIFYIKQFKPNWREKNGKMFLEGGENGNNANLVIYLRNNGIPAEIEETLPSGRRVDIIIDNQLIMATLLRAS
jgi:hypothetical protein